MKNQITNLNSMSALIANTPMTAVNTARMNDCFSKTDSEESRAIIKAMASLDTFDSLYAVKRCEVLANARYTLATHKDFTFKDLCTAFEIDNSNGGAMADTWDKFYSHKDEIYDEFELDIFQYSVNVLKPFKNKDTSRVCKVLKYAGYTLSVKNARAIASAMDISGYIDGVELDKILNGDITTTEKKSDSKSDSKPDSKSDSKSDIKSDSKSDSKSMIFESVEKLVEYFNNNSEKLATIASITVQFNA